MTRYRLQVNGRMVEVEADPAMPLLFVLRDRLGLRGAKYGCGAGLCGACTVHVDGRAERSCLLPVDGLVGREIRTIESLDQTHPVVAAWIREGVAQCGYCQPGLVMAVTAAIEEHGARGVDAVMDSLTNICRCGTAPAVRRAVASLVAVRLPSRLA